MESNGPLPDDPEVLHAITAPTLVIHGSDTAPFGAFSAQYIAEHIPNARLHQIPAAGHASPLTHPEAVAEALSQFLAPTAQPA